MAEIIKHDFGKKGRETARKLAKLLDMLDEHEQDILDHPIKYFRRASQEIVRLRKEYYDIWEIVALATAVNFSPSIEPLSPWDNEIRVRKDEYLALKEAYKRVAKMAGMSS